MRKLTYTLSLTCLIALSACSSSKNGKTAQNKTETKPAQTASAAPTAVPASKESEVKWYNWNDGYQLSLKSNKVVMVDLYTSWCGWCKRMDKDTYTNPDVAEYINKKFIPIKLNPEAQGTYKVDSMNISGSQLMGMLTNNQSPGYPTIVFIYPNRNIELYPGYQDAPGFKATLDKVIDNNNNKKKK